VATGDTLERWLFDLETDKSVGAGDAGGSSAKHHKSEKEIQVRCRCFPAGAPAAAAAGAGAGAAGWLRLTPSAPAV